MPAPKPFKPTHIPDQLELGWLAGFFEGEGSFNICDGRPQVQINNSDLPMLERFQIWIACGRIYPMKPNALSVKPLWVWKTNSIAEAHYVTDLLYSFLSDRRQDMADKICALKPQRAKLEIGGTCINGHNLEGANIEPYPKSNTMGCRICINERRRKKRAEENLIKQQVEDIRNTRQYLGKIAEKIYFDGKLVDRREINGTLLFVFMTEVRTPITGEFLGEVKINWWKPDWLDDPGFTVGEVYKLKAKVKRHEDVPKWGQSTVVTYLEEV